MAVLVHCQLQTDKARDRIVKHCKYNGGGKRVGFLQPETLLCLKKLNRTLSCCKATSAGTVQKSVSGLWSPYGSIGLHLEIKFDQI